MDSDSKRIDSIECLRGISCILVVLYHFKHLVNDVAPRLGNDLFQNGRIGVDIFFILSGFAIYLTTQKENSRVFFPFVIRRIFRIIPVAWVLIFLIYWLSQEWQPIHLIKSLFFIPLSNGDAPYFGYNILTPAWTLSYELIFYMIFGLTLIFYPEKRGVMAAIFIFTMIIGSQAMGGGIFSWDAYNENTYKNIEFFGIGVGIFGSTLFLEFLIGLFIAYIYLNHRSHLLKIKDEYRILLYITMIAFFFNHFFSGFNMGHGLNRKGLAAACIFIFYLAIEFDPILAHLKNNFISGPLGIFRFLGKISFSLYVIHEPIQTFITKIPISNDLYLYTGGGGKFIILISTSIIAAYVLHIFIETPFNKLGKYLSNRFLQSKNSSQDEVCGLMSNEVSK